MGLGRAVTRWGLGWAAWGWARRARRGQDGTEAVWGDSGLGRTIPDGAARGVVQWGHGGIGRKVRVTRERPDRMGQKRARSVAG